MVWFFGLNGGRRGNGDDDIPPLRPATAPRMWTAHDEDGVEIFSRHPTTLSPPPPLTTLPPPPPSSSSPSSPPPPPPSSPLSTSSSVSSALPVPPPPPTSRMPSHSYLESKDDVTGNVATSTTSETFIDDEEDDDGNSVDEILELKEISMSASRGYKRRGGGGGLGIYSGDEYSVSTTKSVKRVRRYTLVTVFCLLLAMVIALAVTMSISQKNKRLEQQNDLSSAADAATTGTNGGSSNADNNRPQSGGGDDDDDDDDDDHDENEDPPSTKSPSPSTGAETTCEDSINIEKSRCFQEGSTINVEFKRCQPENGDWIGFFPAGTDSEGRLFPNEIYWSWTCGEETCELSSDTSSIQTGTVEFTAQTSDGLYKIYLVSGSRYYQPVASSHEFHVKADC